MSGNSRPLRLVLVLVAAAVFAFGVGAASLWLIALSIPMLLGAARVTR